MFSLENLNSLTKSKLISIGKELGIKGLNNKKKNEIINIISKFEDNSEKYIPTKITDKKYNKIYHISDIHIRSLQRHDEYQEVFNRLYKFLKNDIKSNNIIAITGDIIHEKDNLKPETVLLCRKFVKDLSLYGDVIVIPGNHDMLENNNSRIDTLTAILDDSPIYYLSKTGAYQFGNIIIAISSLVDKKFITRKQIINSNNLPIASLYHGTLNGCVNDFGYKIEDTNEYSQRFRKISDFDGYEMVLLGDIHKHQYLKKHIAYPGSLIQQNFGENLLDHGVLIWDIQRFTSKYQRIHNDYGFVNIKVIDNKWSLPQNLPNKIYLRLIVKNSDNKTCDKIKSLLENKLYSFQTKHLTEDQDEIVPEEIKNHKCDIDILLEEMKIRNFDENKQDNILEIHNILKKECSDIGIHYINDMNNQNWKLLKLSFKNVFIFGDNKINIIDFTKLNGVTSIVGPNAIGKSNIINIIIYLLYGSNINFKVPHILNKYQNEYWIEGELMFGAKKFKITKSGKKRKGNKINHSFSFYIFNNNKWVKQDKENNKGTTNLIKTFLGSVNEYLLTNVYSNNSLRSILNLTNAEKTKALSKLFSLDIYEHLEKLAKKNITSLKKDILKLESEKSGLLYNFEDIDNLHKNTIKTIEQNKNELKELKNKILLTNKKYNENKNILDKLILQKDILSNKILYLEDKDFNEIKRKVIYYQNNYNLKLERKDINILLQKIYQLQSQIIPVDIPITNINILKENKNNILLKIKKYNENLKKCKEKKIKYQEELNNIYSKIIYIFDKKYKDNSHKIKNLNLIIKEVPKKEIIKETIIKLKVQLIDFIPRGKPTINGSYNKDEINKLKNEINIKLPKFKKVSVNTNKEFINTLNKPLKLKNLPDTPYDNIEDVENEIKKLNLINLIKEINEKMNTLDKMINKKDEIKNLKQFYNLFKKIKNTINNDNFSFLTKLIKYRNIYYENIEIENNNNLYYSYVEELNIYNKKRLNLLLQYEYSHKYNLYEKCLYYEKLLKYLNLYEDQKEYNKYIENKKINIEFENKKDIIKKNTVKNNEKIIKYKNKVQSYSKKLDNINKDIENINIHDNNNKILKEISKINDDIKKEELIRDYDCLLMELKEENRYIENKNNKKEISFLQEKIDTLKSKLEIKNNEYFLLNEKIIVLERDIKSSNNYLDNITNIFAKRDNINKKLKELNIDIGLYNSYLNLINKNNIPSKLINKKVIYLQNHINIFLKLLTKYRLVIDIDEKSSINFIIKKGGIDLDVNQLSGYETFILNIALKSSLNKYSFISKSTLFILDEGLDVVDKDNFKKLNLLMELMMRNYKNILLISQMSKVKDLKTSNINIFHKNGSSSITYTY